MRVSCHVILLICIIIFCLDSVDAQSGFQFDYLRYGHGYNNYDRGRYIANEIRYHFGDNMSVGLNLHNQKLFDSDLADSATSSTWSYTTNFDWYSSKQKPNRCFIGVGIGGYLYKEAFIFFRPKQPVGVNVNYLGYSSRIGFTTKHVRIQWDYNFTFKDNSSIKPYFVIAANLIFRPKNKKNKEILSNN